MFLIEVLEFPAPVNSAPPARSSTTSPAVSHRFVLPLTISSQLTYEKLEEHALKTFFATFPEVNKSFRKPLVGGYAARFYLSRGNHLFALPRETAAGASFGSIFGQEKSLNDDISLAMEIIEKKPSVTLNNTAVSNTAVPSSVAGAVIPSSQTMTPIVANKNVKPRGLSVTSNTGLPNLDAKKDKSKSTGETPKLLSSTSNDGQLKESVSVQFKETPKNKASTPKAAEIPKPIQFDELVLKRMRVDSITSKSSKKSDKLENKNRMQDSVTKGPSLPEKSKEILGKELKMVEEKKKEKKQKNNSNDKVKEIAAIEIPKPKTLEKLPRKRRARSIEVPEENGDVTKVLAPEVLSSPKAKKSKSAAALPDKVEATKPIEKAKDDKEKETKEITRDSDFSKFQKPQLVDFLFDFPEELLDSQGIKKSYGMSYYSKKKTKEEILALIGIVLAAEKTESQSIKTTDKSKDMDGVKKKKNKPKSVEESEDDDSNSTDSEPEDYSPDLFKDYKDDRSKPSGSGGNADAGGSKSNPNQKSAQGKSNGNADTNNNASTDDSSDLSDDTSEFQEDAAFADIDLKSNISLEDEQDAFSAAKTPIESIENFLSALSSPVKSVITSPVAINSADPRIMIQPKIHLSGRGLMGRLSSVQRLRERAVIEDRSKESMASVGSNSVGTDNFTNLIKIRKSVADPTRRISFQFNEFLS